LSTGKILLKQDNKKGSAKELPFFVLIMLDCVHQRGCVRKREKYRDQTPVATFTGKCAVKLRKEGAATSLLTVFIGTSPFEAKEAQYWGTKTASLPYPTQDSIALQRATQVLLESLFRIGYAYKKAGVIVSDLMPVQSSGRTLSLFPEDQPAPNERDKKLMLVIDGTNERYGRGAVRLASENSEGWNPNQERLSPYYTTRWSDIVIVTG
jgi:DNA polymerase V